MTPAQIKTIYGMTEQVSSDIDNRFRYHSPRGDQAERYQLLRDKAREFAVLIAVNSPPSREQSLAFTKLEECVMWTNAGIARNEKVT